MDVVVSSVNKLCVAEKRAKSVMARKPPSSGTANLESVGEYEATSLQSWRKEETEQ